MGGPQQNSRRISSLKLFSFEHACYWLRGITPKYWTDKQKLKETVASGSLDRKSSVNMLIGCVDNWEARQVLEAVSAPRPEPS